MCLNLKSVITLSMFICTCLCGDKPYGQLSQSDLIKSVTTEKEFFNQVIKDINTRIFFDELTSKVIIGNYGEVIETYPVEYLYRGERSYVYKSTYNGKDYVIKRVLAQNLPYNESEILRKLIHKNIVTVYDITTIEKYKHILMEYLPINLYTTKDSITTLKIAIDITIALVYMNEKYGLTHNDIKIHNIRGTNIGEEIVYKLIDFEGSLYLNEGRSYDGELGTPGYESPEAAIYKKVTYKSDIWSIGTLIIYLANDVICSSVVFPEVSDEEKENFYITLIKSKLINDELKDVTDQLLIIKPEARPNIKDTLKILQEKYIELNTALNE